MDRADQGGWAKPSVAPTPTLGAKSVLADWTRALAATAVVDSHPTRTLPVLIERVAEQAGDTPAIVSDGERFTYGALNSRINQYGRWARAAGLSRGDTVALLMENRPEYVATWLGLTKIGITVALLNTNLRDAALAHCVVSAAPAAAIVSASLEDAWDSAVSHMPSLPSVYVHGDGGSGRPRIDTAVDTQSGETAPPDEKAVTVADRALLIYTSGTTGLPKAANVSHGRILSWSLWFAGMLDTGPADRMYDCLPLYHSVGGVVAVGALLARGGSVVVAPSFSASRFWSDVVRWDCTLAQYIGELCRYLLSAPDTPAHRGHGLRAICGNGLRADVWREFQARFSVPRIVEFYAASEGTFSLYNMEGEPGAIGRIPAFLSHRFPAALVRYDEATGLPFRDAAGRCVRVSKGEVGEAIGRISATKAGAQSFEGYTDEKATQSKIVRGIFADGDAWVRTGDLMRIDERGFWYFVDRIGDTFRWKGENVATTEVAAVVSSFKGVLDVTVFGVAVPQADGRAGMAALTLSSQFDLAGFTAHVTARLPAYARPIFLRFTESIDVTGTFKHQTRALQEQGIDPAKTNDRLMVYDSATHAYTSLDVDRFRAICRGTFRL